MTLRYAKCIECGSLAKPTTGKTVYPHRADLHKLEFFLCQCGAYCGTHKGTGRPLGSPAGPATRAARSKAHRAFDTIWKERHMSRQKAYRWLSETLGIEHLNCHIALMDRDTAERVVKVSRVKLEELRREAREAAE